MKRILVVDDKANVRTMLRDYFTEQGYRIITAENGQAALYAARRDKPDLVLLDLTMPDLDGWAWGGEAELNGEALELWQSRPTVNIEGLVGGYTGPGGKTILPHRAVAKLDLRLVPDMTAAGALAALKNHLAKRGFGDIEVNMTGGYDPTSTPAGASLISAETAVYKRSGIDPVLLPRNAGWTMVSSRALADCSARRAPSTTWI